MMVRIKDVIFPLSKFFCVRFSNGRDGKSEQLKNVEDPFVIFFLSKMTNLGEKNSFPKGIEEKTGKQIECQMMLKQ